jgi:periplasmic protein CpxP/Spy
MKSILGRTMAVAALAMAALAVGAQEPAPPAPGGPGFGPGFGGHRPPMERALGPMGTQGRFWQNQAMVDRLKLTDDQRKSMDQVLEQNRNRLIDLRANLEKAEGVLEPLMRDDQPNESRILEQIDQVAQARAELEKANARFLLAIRAKLTPEQWKSLQAARSERIERWRQGGPQGGPMMRHQGAAPQGAPTAPPPPQQ